MMGLFSEWHAQYGLQVNTTVVGLGASEEDEIQDYVNAYLPVTDGELRTPKTVAAKMAEYVATCVKERRASLSGR
jgi:hypothetical protein